ncbi:MAG: nucleoside kinase [Bacteroidota bacterium]
MNTTIAINCVNSGTTKIVGKGTSLREVIEQFDVKMKNPILGALVNNVLEELTFEIFHPVAIQFIDITHPDGMRMYLRSLSFVLCKAVRELFADSHLRINHSIAKGIYCRINSFDKELSLEDVASIKVRMQEIIDANLPFINIEEETKEVILKFEAQGLTDKINLLKHKGQNFTTYYNLGGHLGSFYGCMVPSTGYLKVFDLNKYFNGMLLQLPQKNNPVLVENLVVQNKLFEIFQEFSQWIKILEVPNISDLNNSCSNGKSEVLIKVSEALHEKKIGQIADNIRQRKDHVKIILISGPSSSGKTTFAKRLAIHLIVNGMKPLNLSLDNYFVDRDNTPLDENGNHDYEAVEALDVVTFNQNLLALLNGEKVELPRFSFETGTRFYNGETMQMLPENVLIIEGIHGLNPELTSSIPAEAKFKIYVSALTSLNIDNHNRVSTTDNRLIRRIVRDYRYRKYSARETISRWQSVRQGEEKHIFPFQEEADTMFNSALLYELAVLKPFAEPILLEVQANQPEYSEAVRLLDFFSYFKPLKPTEIPPTSILREFLGGSSFIY